MKRRAFTLVELIVSISIFLLLIGTIYYALGTQLRFLRKITNKGENQQISNMVLSRIVQDIRCAEEILSASNTNSLFLKVGSDTIEYALKNQKVKRKKNNYSSYLTDVEDIQKLTFSYPANRTVQISLEAWTTKAYLRN